MFCNKCGLPINDDETTCPSCGTKVEKEELTVQETENGVTPKRNRKLGKKGICIIAGVTACVVAIVVLVLNFSVLSNAIRRTVTSPASYYRYVEKKNTTEALQNVVTGLYAQTPKDWDNFYSDNTMTIALNDYTMDLIGALTGMNNLSWLQYIGMTVDVSLQTIYDLNKEEVYVKIPELSKSYMGMSFANMEDAQMPAIQELYNMISIEESLHMLLERYSEKFLSNIEQVEKSKDVVTALELTKEVYQLTVTLDAKTVKMALLEMIAEAKEDIVIEELLQSFDKVNTDAQFSFYDSFMTILMESEAELMAWDAERETEYVLMNVYVDNRGVICGREVSLCEASNETELFSFAFVQNGSKMALETTLHGDINARVTGTAERKKNEIEGALLCSVNGEDVLQIGLENWKITQLVQGKISGTVKVKLLDGFSSAFGLRKEAAFLLVVFSDYFLQMDLNVEEQTAAYTYSLCDDSVSYITVTLNSNMGTPSMTPPSPTDAIMVEDETGVNAWVQTIDLEKVKEHLQTTPLPEEWISLIEIFAGQLQ